MGMGMGIAIGHLSVQRGALINASPVTVWQDFTTEERLKAWFG
jgi:uncharacterized protein YndB with AHSA1/START domain